MGKIDFNVVYSDRIKQIDIDIKKAVSEKKWTLVAKLRAEKARLEEILEVR